MSDDNIDVGSSDVDTADEDVADTLEFELASDIAELDDNISQLDDDIAKLHSNIAQLDDIESEIVHSHIPNDPHHLSPYPQDMKHSGNSAQSSSITQSPMVDSTEATDHHSSDVSSTGSVTDRSRGQNDGANVTKQSSFEQQIPSIAETIESRRKRATFTALHEELKEEDIMEDIMENTKGGYDLDSFLELKVNSNSHFIVTLDVYSQR